MSIASWISFLCAAVLSFALLSAGQARLTSRITPEVHHKQIEREASDSPSFVPLSPSAFRKVLGVIDIACGILLIWPSYRRMGALVTFVLLFQGVFSRIRSGNSITPPVVMMFISALVWVLGTEPTAA